MKILEFFDKIPQFFDWYFRLTQIKRIQLNYLTIIFIITIGAYYNDKRHSNNYFNLSARVDTINNLRSKEQERYMLKLENYTDKFKGLLEKNMEQKEKIEQLKEEQK